MDDPHAPPQPWPDHWFARRPAVAPSAPRGPWLLTARAIAEVLFATEAGPPPAARLSWLAAELDDFFQHAGAQARVTWVAGLTAVATLAPVLVKRPPLSLAALPPPLRLTALERFERTPIGIALFAVKAILSMLYYEHPDAARAMGFEGACLHPSVVP